MIANTNIMKYNILQKKSYIFNVREHIKAFMAGMFIAFGCAAMGIVKSDTTLSPAISSILSGMIFSIGLFAIVSCGSRLFTGNCLIWINVLKGDVDFRQFLFMLLHDWLFNFLGVVFVVLLINISGFNCFIFTRILELKVHNSSLQLIFKGILCNLLVCLSVWMCIGQKEGLFIKTFIPVTVFIACGFEHSIADMFFTMFYITDVVQPLTTLLLVTAGNLIGGIIFASLIYYSCYSKLENNNA